ncbi:MAG: SDR family oxidoreductase [Oscillospiraceae bacterium]|jgi:NAD(P)-dependent dehydrogenase (short-subunit alcohol dehydrogenase family)|nr:SDR family oxidoreductase [Oscillospiraceae bacterium]
MSFIKTPPITGMQAAYSVAGKNVVVTGGNRGIGFGISKAFAESGANVAVLCRNTKSGEEAVSQLKKLGSGKFFTVPCDIADSDSVKDAAAAVLREFGNVDVLVNNAGVATTVPFLSEGGLQEWHRVLDTNLNGTANAVYAFAPAMKEAGRGGAIINITSIGGDRVSNAKEHDNAPYFCSKAALNKFSEYLAIVLGDYGIRVNSVAPGPTHSDLDKDLPANAFEMIENMMPAHRFAEPIEIGALCVFLASPAGNHVTGQIMTHDGGMRIIT